jgi:hypothetical protein
MPDMCPSITDHEIEAEARAMLREAIERAGWYPSLLREFRQARIDQDVDHMWHLMIVDARTRLEQGIRRGCQDL